METPTPAVPPTPTEAEAAAMMAEISEVLAALRETLPALVRLLFSMKARVSVSTTLRATAPAPLTEIPAVPPMPTASEAATV